MSESSKGIVSEKSDTSKILIIYHSGSGSTKTVCEILKTKLSSYYTIDIFNLFHIDNNILNNYDFIVFGFPTYHCQPSKSMIEYVENLPILSEPKKALILTTYGLYSGDSIQMLAKKLTKKNIVVVDYCGIRGPASDGVLTLPTFLTFMFNYEKSASVKIQNMEQVIKTTIDTNPNYGSSKIPSSKWYVPLNNIIRTKGEDSYDKMKNKISIDLQKCKKCDICAKNCGRNCWTHNDSTPLFNPENCEFCLKCIHNCPEKAIYFSDKMRERAQLNKAFYESLKKKLMQ